MQAFKTEPRSAEQISRETAPHREPVAQISLRAVTALEIVSVVGSALLTVWAVVPIYPYNRLLMAIPAVFALALMINSHRLRGETLRELGFTTQYFGRAVRLLALPVLLGCGLLVAIGFLNDSFHRSTNFWANLFIVPVWGVLQQYVLQGFIYRRVRSLLVEESLPPQLRARRVQLAIVVTAALFALVHIPNFTLTVLTFVAGLIWSWVYQRAPNLIALGLSHGLLSMLLMTSLPSWLLQSMSVGYKHFLYQKF